MVKFPHIYAYYAHLYAPLYAPNIGMWGILEKSRKNAAHKRWPEVRRTLQSKVKAKKNDFWDFHSTSTSTETSDGWQWAIYGSINLKKFMKPSFAQPKNISEDQTSNPKKKNFATGYSTLIFCLKTNIPFKYLKTDVWNLCFYEGQFWRAEPPFFTKWCDLLDLSKWKKLLDLVYIYPWGVRGGIALIFFWKSVFEKHPSAST